MLKFKKGRYEGRTYRDVCKKDVGYLAWLMEEYGDKIETMIMDECGELFRVYFRKLLESKPSEAKKYPRAMKHIQEDSTMVQILRKLNRIEALLVEVLDRNGGSKK